MLSETLSEQVREQTRLRRIKKHHDEKESNNTSSRMSVRFGVFIPLLIVDCGITFIYPFVLPQYPFFFARVLGYSAAQFGIIVSIYGLALAVSPMLLGRLGEVFPKKLLIILGSLLYSFLNVGMLFFHQFGLLIGAAMATGIGNALLIPTLSTFYLGATTEQNRSQVIGI